ncbi:atypical/RIO/RIO1 protein kinase [Ceratobasidium sp. AG-Ba]|nr:atypical/RIO/RIO1 protein kinase [Ceratobasidium sp. AG-Ba]
MDVIVRFAKPVLSMAIFNEFNILIRRETGIPVVIDFPQMVSTRHANAEWYFNRDVECIRRFFRRRFNYESAVWRKRRTGVPARRDRVGKRLRGKDMKLLDEYIASKLQEGGSGSDEPEDEDEGEDSGDGYPEFRQMRPAAQDFSTKSKGALVRSRLGALDKFIAHTRNKGEEPGQARDDDDEELPSDHDARHDASDSDGEDREDPAPSKSTVRDLVASTLEKERRRNAKHHSKRGTTKLGEPRGIRARQTPALEPTLRECGIDVHLWE